MTLDEIGTKFKTDKSSMHHHYLGLYELLFAKIKELPEQRILEIGTQFGNSLMTWKDYFPFPVITGIDSVDNGVLIDRVEIIIGNAYSPDVWSKVSDMVFDIIIDDADHSPTSQGYAIQHYSTLLSYSGILIVEDVQATTEYLKGFLPPEFQYTAVDMTEGTGNDSRLFICWRK